MAIRTLTGVNSGVGFAIPVVVVGRVVPELISHGRYRHPWIGVSGRTISQEMVETMDLPVETGVLLFTVEPDSPAERANLHGGVRVVSVSGVDMRAGGDILIAINEVVVRNFDDLINFLASQTSVGDEVTLTVVRDGAELKVGVTLEERPDDR
jgi:2-alkenal reductase